MPRTANSRRLAIALAAASACAVALPLIAASAPASAASSVHYVALGDSYSSGLGAGNYIASSGSCDRSNDAYPALWSGANLPATYTSVACAGATTSTVLSSQISAQRTSTWPVCSGLVKAISSSFRTSAGASNRRGRS